MNIIDEIRALKDAPLKERFPNREGALLIPNHNIADLKALAESHERLLHAARQWVRECRIEYTEEEIANDHEIRLFDEAIKQAEKLKAC